MTNQKKNIRTDELFSVKYPKMSSFSQVVEALTGLIYHRPSGENFSSLKAHLAASRNVHIAAKLLQKDLRKLAKWCAKWRIKLNPEKTKVILFSRSYLAGKPEPTLNRAVGTAAAIAAALFGLSVFLFTENPLKCFIL